MRLNLFFRLLFSFLLIGLIPLISFNFLVKNGYQGLIDKYGPIIEKYQPQLISETKLNYKNITYQNYLLLSLMIVFILFLSAIFVRSFIFPIQKLIQAVKEFQKGNLKKRVIFKTGDEFELLANAFNEMAEKLSKTYEELLKAKENLEEKVRKRTKELEELNLTLDEKVRERTQELEKSRKALMNILEDLQLTQSELEKERNKTLAIIENFTDGLLVFDKDKRVFLCNRKAQEILKIKKEEAEGKFLDQLKDNPFFAKIYQLLVESNWKVFRKEVILGNLTFQLSLVSLKIKNQKEINFLILHDITREKEIDRMKSEFVSLAAHQLRTPLSGLKWGLSMLLEGDFGKISKQQKQILERTYNMNERMIDLINDLLNVARIEEGKFYYKKENINVSEILKNVLKELKQIADKKEIKIEISIQEKVPEIFGDKEKLSFVFQNLIENAIIYNKKGGKIFITLKYKEKQKEIFFSVKDTGIGILKEDQSKIFSKFFRGSLAMKASTVGSGLGLYVVKNIIEAHGGKIWFESEGENKGTTFYFVLPVKNK